MLHYAAFLCFFGFQIYSNGQLTTTKPFEDVIIDIFGTPPPDVPVVSERTPDPTFPNSSSTDCECVQYDLCDKNGTIKTGGEDIIDIRRPQCPVGEICCKKPIDPSEITERPVYQRRQSCGRRNYNGVGFRITTPNSEAQFGEFPWMICLLKVFTSDSLKAPEYFCGGSLIHPGVVMTTTHCVKGIDISQVIVRAGEWDSGGVYEVRPHQERTITEVVSHPNFSSGGLYNDISLLFLSEPFEFAENVDVICLPTHEVVSDNIECVASGWGKDKFGKDGIFQNILKSVKQPTVNRKTCQTKLRNTRLGFHFQLHQSFVCAGGRPGEDTCEGDGGSPLVCPIGDSADLYQQVGMVAWGIECGKAVPAVYVNVAHFRPWIDAQLIKRNLRTDYYSSK